MSNSSHPHNQPTATGTLSTSNSIIFGQVPAVRAIIPMSQRPGPVSVYASVFARRSFHRVAFIVGIGSVAIAGWWVYQHYCAERAKLKGQSPTPPPLQTEEIAEKKSAQELGVSQEKNMNDVAEQESEDDLLEKNVILYQCPRGYFTPCIAPFALKLETFLRVANIPYEIKFKGQPQADDAPWITIGNREIAESQKCIPALCRIFKIDLIKDASESRKSAANLVDNTLDNRIFWGIALWRWVFDSGNSMKEIQPVAVPMASQMIQDVSESVKKAAWYHGIGRHSQEEVVEKVNKDLNDLAVALGKHNYFMGERPAEVDCNAFAMLSQMVWNMPKSPFELEIRKYPNLIGFIFRMKEKYWPDWNDILHSADNESMASESVRLYSTGEFTRSRTGVSSQSSKSSTVHLSREPSILPPSKSKRSNPEIHSSDWSPKKAGSKDNNLHGLQNIVAESQNSMAEQEIRKVNSDRSSHKHHPHENREQKMGQSLNPTQSEPEQLSHNYNSNEITNPFNENFQVDDNKMSPEEINNLLSALANRQVQHSNGTPPPQEFYHKHHATTNFNFNGQQQYQNSFAANKQSPFPGQIIAAPNQPLSAHAYPQNAYNPQPQYGNYDPSYNDQAKFFQIRDAIHAVTAQSAGARESYSTNISKLNQILNDLSISQPQTAFEHSTNVIPTRHWNSPVVHQQQPQPQQVYYVDSQYGQHQKQQHQQLQHQQQLEQQHQQQLEQQHQQQLLEQQHQQQLQQQLLEQQHQQQHQQQPMMNSTLQNPNNPFM